MGCAACLWPAHCKVLALKNHADETLYFVLGLSRAFAGVGRACEWGSIKKGRLFSHFSEPRYGALNCPWSAYCRSVALKFGVDMMLHSINETVRTITSSQQAREREV